MFEVPTSYCGWKKFTVHNVSRLTDFVPDLQVEKVGFQVLLSTPGIFIFYFKEFRCRKDKKKIRPAK